MKRVIIYILLLMPLFASAQRMEIVTVNRASGEVKRQDGVRLSSVVTDSEREYVAVFGYGLPRAIVKSNREMKAAVHPERGITQRHHTTLGVDFAILDGEGHGYSANKEISFCFLVAPHNVDINGLTHDDVGHDETNGEKLTWTEASGWNSSIATESASTNGANGVGDGAGASLVAQTPTGCSAYRGADGTDAPGTWRLPTQREAQVMFTIIGQVIDIQGGDGGDGESVNHIVNGIYWTSTEVYNGNEPWKTWAISTTTGTCDHYYRDDLNRFFARCIRDITTFSTNDVDNDTY